MIHRELLVSKSIPSILAAVLNEVVEVVNYIKTSALRSRISFIDTEKVDFSILEDDVWWLRVSFLSDLFDKLNEVNLSLQGAEEKHITISRKLKAFKEKLTIWNSKVSKSIC